MIKFIKFVLIVAAFATAYPSAAHNTKDQNRKDCIHLLTFYGAVRKNDFLSPPLRLPRIKEVCDLYLEELE